MLILIFYGCVPELIRDLHSFRRTDSTDNWGFMEMPGMLERDFLLARMIETSMDLTSFTRIGRLLDSVYFPSRRQSRIGFADMLAATFFSVSVHLVRSWDTLSCLLVPFGCSEMP